jgi:thioester reductase-like protein
MTAVLLTGFPGFLGSALLPRILAKRDGARAICVVQDRHMGAAQERLTALAAQHPHIADRVDLVVGDITRPGLGIQERPEGITEVFHLAAVYDLAVAEEFAKKVNVDGTANVIQFCKELPDFHRLQYVSTCYVSGRYEGRFPEDGLELGQEFQNHYESTKYEAERLVRAAIADGLPATIYRPGIVVGDSTTGETQKYDGPYFVAHYMLRLPEVAFLPMLDASVKASMVPRDFVIGAIDELSVRDVAVGKTYALTDPNPPNVKQTAEIIGKCLGRRPVWLPVPVPVLRGVIDKVPGMEMLTGLPPETLDYFTFPTTYDTTNATTDLAGTGIQCPEFADYACTLLTFMREHPEFGSAAMV